ncbi:MAG TPA: nuclear transport factor 2 family protein [Edaphobacter sp.]|jgi:ketosteroid isomerase-like protein
MAETPQNKSQNEAALLEIFNRWSKAVRDEDIAAIRANHDPDMLMFDVPPPFQSHGINAYTETWKLFYSSVPKPVKFDFDSIQIHTGEDVAFLSAVGHCRYSTPSGEIVPLDFRLTMGFHKRDGRWMIVHEHHSVPSVD